MNEPTATKEISIHDESFLVSAPYAEGYTINAVEAKTLNQTRAENIANNFRKRIKAAIDGVPLKEGGEVETLESIREAFADYDSKYTFSMPSPGREPLDPVEREALKIARQAIKDALAEAGKKLKDIDEEVLEKAIAQAAESEEVQKEAKRRVKAQKGAAVNALAGLGLVTQPAAA